MSIKYTFFSIFFYKISNDLIWMFFLSSILFLGTFTFDSKLNKTTKERTASVSGGMIEGNRMIEFLYQFTYSLSKKGRTIIPNQLITFKYSSRGEDRNSLEIQYNPLQVFLDASYCSMALHSFLSRRKYSKSDLEKLELLITLTQITVHRLFILKQLLTNNTTGTSVLKLHLIIHFVLVIRLFGYLMITNTDKSESAHVQLKEDYSNSSKKLSNCNKEMMERNRIQHISSNISSITSNTNNNIPSVLENKSDYDRINNNSSKIKSTRDVTLNSSNSDGGINNGGNSTLSSIPDLFSQNQPNGKSSMEYMATLGFIHIKFHLLHGKNSEFIIQNIKSQHTLPYIILKQITILQHGELSIPIHPLLGLNGLLNLLFSNYNDPNKAIKEGWTEIFLQSIRNKAKIQLLNGSQLVYNEDGNLNTKYNVFSKRDHEVLSAPGINSRKILRERFNFIEVFNFKNIYIIYDLV